MEPEQLKQGLLQLLVNGIVYAPIHLTGLVNNLFAEGKTSINGYEGEAPRFENGEFTLTNAFLEAGGIDQYIVINGHLRFAKDLNMEKYEEKIKKLEINGIVTIYANQEMYFHKKVTSTNSQLITIIPDGYEVIDKKLHVNARNIRRFQNKKIYTKRPIILDKDISRDALSKAITSIESTSFVVCHESLEDLLYEITSNMKTEILPYDDSYILIEGEETWSKEELLALESATNFIIKGKLIFQQDVDRDVLMAKVASLDNFGVVAVNDTKLKGTLQSVLRVNNGEIRESGKQVERSVLKNVGELSL
ncbi:MAG: hypothetical protein LRY73_11185 [Bacillus sp. (in: Bacteria)]|nr:hypothetical protein [Bacillus sp. (in: firmicutes)]